MAQKTTPKKTVAEDPRFTQAMQNYESGLRAMQEHKFEKAKGLFLKVLGGPTKNCRIAPTCISVPATSNWNGAPLSSKVLKSTTTTPFP